MIEESDAEPVDVVQALKDSGADVLVSYLPVGSQEATEFYAGAALEAGVGFVNAIPVFIASDQEWAQKFVDAGLRLVRRSSTVSLRASSRIVASRSTTHIN